MKNNLKEILKLVIVLLSLFGIMFFFGWFTGAKSNTNPRNEYNDTIESFENDYVNNKLDSINY